MKIKQKLIDAKNSVVDFGKEHGRHIANVCIGVTYVAAVAYLGVAIHRSKQEVALDIENGFMEIDGKEYKLSEDGDFITVEEWDEHTK